MAEIILNENNFESEVLNCKLPVLVDFWAEWCGPCKMLSPTIQDIADEFEGVAKVCKLNVDEAPSVAAKYGIMNIPTVLVFKNGEITGKSVGFVPKEQLTKLLK